MMLEVKNLRRVYKVKNGKDVYALNNISLKFPETGLVFILGKSGSGKSTLLNVMGGLDYADDGEIIINGKSSKEFTGSEMDSYRNTYLGFIFQEYNILEDFTVKENIALALELQHKKATDEVIDGILKEVDLEGYGKRKPNELSGGQKQRVAIARALVKEPKIIFGDEPTGALDSNTGKQVFETLKKLSKDKLVVIVSHDRDFAEHFGDRVIELKDGVVISDITKSTVESKKPREGLSVVGDNVIKLSKNRPLTAEDIPIINETILKSDSEVYITADSHVNEAICEAARIDTSGNREEFFKTDPDSIKVEQSAFNIIKSKFRLSSAIKMGLKSLKVKPVRLFFTILLSVIAFTLFGESATLAMFNEVSAMEQSISSNNMVALPVTKSTNFFDGNYFTSSDIDEIKSKGVNAYQVESVESGISIDISRGDYFHQNYIDNIVEIQDTEQFKKDTSFELLAGKWPTNNNEACITKYTYYTYKDYGILSDSAVYTASSDVNYDSVVNNITYTCEGKEYKVVGIIDTKLSSNFEQYRESEKMTQLRASTNDVLSREIQALSTSSIHSYLYVGSANDVESFQSTILLITYEGNYKKISNFLNFFLGKYKSYNNKDGNWYMRINSDIVNITLNTSQFIVIITQVFLWIGVVLAAFSMLLFYTFISASINNKKREIGILRAVGAKKSDVFKIFYIEALTIGLINFLISTALTFIFAIMANNAFKKSSYIVYNIMNPNFLIVLLLFGIAILASTISALLPVIKIANKKPIDAIQNR